MLTPIEHSGPHQELSTFHVQALIRCWCQKWASESCVRTCALTHTDVEVFCSVRAQGRKESIWSPLAPYSRKLPACRILIAKDRSCEKGQKELFGTDFPHEENNASFRTRHTFHKKTPYFLNSIENIKKYGRIQTYSSQVETKIRGVNEGPFQEEGPFQIMV